MASPSVIEDDYLRRAMALIEHAIRRRWNEGMITKDPDGVFTAFLGAADVEKLLQGGMATPAEDVEGIGDFAWVPDAPFATFGASLGLAASQLDLVAVLLACETDPRASRLATYVGGNQVMHALTFELVLDIVYRARYPRRADAAAALFGDLAPEGILRRLGCILVDGADQRVALAQGVRLDRRIAAWLLGKRDLDPDLRAYTCAYLPSEPPTIQPVRALLEPVVSAVVAGDRLIDLQGPPRSGRELLARQAAAVVKRPLLVTSARGLGAARIIAAFREARLTGALLAFTDADELLTGDAVLAFQAGLTVFDDSVMLIGVRDHRRAIAGLRPTTTVTVEVPAFGERLALWRDHLGATCGLAADALERLAATYNLGLSGIVVASERAREAARFAERPVCRADVQDAVRDLFDNDLTTIARRVEVHQEWADLVLPEDLRRTIDSILDRIPFRGRVLGDWGFARKVGKGLGLTVLFSGEPGTGKSMVAGLIARELGLDLYVVDLSQVASKWLGETEKNLGRAFDAAETGHAVLLFDEADSLFAKRTADVRSSNDRYANQETNYVLARLEQFGGIAMFTTNLGNAIDPAVSRRMSFTVRFQFPDEETRATLWHRMLPAQAPVSPRINFAELARRYEVAGGIIRNMALRAAYLAARAQQPIDMEHLVAAAEMEYRDRGSLATHGKLT